MYSFIFRILLLVGVVFTTAFPVYAKEEQMRAVITTFTTQTIEVELKEGELAGTIMPVVYFDEQLIERFSLEEGSTVLVSIPQNTKELGVMIVDKYRVPSLIWLFLLFFLVVIGIGKKKGVMSFIGMIITFGFIGNMIVPQILLGTNPIVISLLAALFLIPLSFYISHGINTKTTVAIVGTFLSLVLTGLLAVLFVNLSKLTGYSSDEVTFLVIDNSQIHLQSLLLAGIIIGAMGVLDDITISQAAIVEKLKQANRNYSFWKLFTESMDVGRDHIASLVNTLFLVYAGASLPLFVLFHSNQFGAYWHILNMELVATEVIRTLVSSIGIIAAVPITTFLAARFIKA
ncbi:MAG: YibE/F family protein [bacterium]|nr:YibE/F family protein [bacterium]